VGNPELVTSHVSSDSPVLLYDGACGVCAWSVQFVLQREPPHRRGALRFAPLQGAFGTALRARYPELEGVDSVVWFDPTNRSAPVRVRSDAALRTLRHLGGVWALVGMLGRCVPRPIRDAAYNAIATRRMSLAAPRCLLPTPDERLRFLE
jgi:predicted DCC family thiol-disulfide oxidoreductase YuxK